MDCQTREVVECLCRYMANMKNLNLRLTAGQKEDFWKERKENFCKRAFQHEDRNRTAADDLAIEVSHGRSCGQGSSDEQVLGSLIGPPKPIVDVGQGGSAPSSKRRPVSWEGSSLRE